LTLFYFVIAPSVSPIVIVVIYHLVPKPETFEIIPLSFKLLNTFFFLNRLCEIRSISQITLFLHFPHDYRAVTL
jgi:hypothetical protein